MSEPTKTEQPADPAGEVKEVELVEADIASAEAVEVQKQADAQAEAQAKIDEDARLAREAEAEQVKLDAEEAENEEAARLQAIEDAKVAEAKEKEERLAEEKAAEEKAAAELAEETKKAGNTIQIPFISYVGRHESLSYSDTPSGTRYTLNRKSWTRLLPEDLVYFKEKVGDGKGAWRIKFETEVKKRVAHYMQWDGAPPLPARVDLDYGAVKLSFPKGKWVEIGEEFVERLSAKALNSTNWHYKKKAIPIGGK